MSDHCFERWEEENDKQLDTHFRKHLVPPCPSPTALILPRVVLSPCKHFWYGDGQPGGWGGLCDGSCLLVCVSDDCVDHL